MGTFLHNNCFLSISQKIEDDVSKILHENDIHVKNLEITENFRSKKELLYFIEPCDSKKIHDLHEQLQRQNSNILITF